MAVQYVRHDAKKETWILYTRDVFGGNITQKLREELQHLVTAFPGTEYVHLHRVLDWLRNAFTPQHVLTHLTLQIPIFIPSQDHVNLHNI